MNEQSSGSRRYRRGNWHTSSIKMRQKAVSVRDVGQAARTVMRESKDVAFTARRHDEISVVETTIEQAAV